MTNFLIKGLLLTRPAIINEVSPHKCDWSLMIDSKNVSSELSDDLNLIEEVQLGNQESARLLFRKYRYLVYSVVARLIPNESDVMDIVQQTFIAAFKQLHTFQGKSKLSTWLARIAVNLSLNHRRQMARRETVPLEEYHLENSEDQKGDLAKELTEKERHVQIRRIIDSLSPNHRAVVVLYDLQGFSYEEVSQVLGCSIGTVMSRLYYARKILKEKFLPLMEEMEEKL